MKNCENCNNEHEGKYGSGRFCSKRCARGFSTKAKRKEINEKVSKTITQKLLNGETVGRYKINFNKYDVIFNNITNKKQKCLKIKYCISCSQEIISGQYCKECKKYLQNRTLFKKLGITTKNLILANREAIDILYKEYFINKLPKSSIQQKYNILSNSLYDFFKKNNIKLRTLSEANLLSLEEGRAQLNTSHTNFKNGWHITWDKRNVYYRSSYELQYAERLDLLKEKYFMEYLKIRYYDSQKNKIRIAIPDFYLEKTNCIVEIKSSFTYDEINMNDKIEAYKKLGYNVKLILDLIEK